jgi:hypothetical protein
MCVCMYVYVCICMYVYIYVRTYACVCIHVCTHGGMCIQHTKSACVHDQIRICHFLKQQLLLLQLTLIAMYLPQSTILRATVRLAAKAVKQT